MADTKEQREQLTKSLNMQWTRVVNEVGRRDAALRLRLEEKKAFLESVGIIELTAADLFVEKAQIKLTERARNSFYWGALFLTLTLTMLAVAFCLIYSRAYGELLPKLTGIEKAIAPYIAGEHFVRLLALGALVLGTVYLFASLGRAFLHEGTALLNRRHAVRLGRLFVYLKFASVKEPCELREIRNSLSVRDIEEAFGWNLQASTAFKDIRADVVSQSILGQMGELIGRLTDLVSKQTREQHGSHSDGSR